MEEMLHDYRPKKTAKLSSKNQNKSQQATQKSSHQLNRKWLISFGLVILIISLTFLAVKIELAKFYRIKTNERVLLLQDQRPIASLFFDVNNKQIAITDLREINFSSTDLEQTATLAGELNQNLFYAFLLGTVFDNTYDYSQTDLNKTSLLSFFKDKKPYYFFLQDKNLLWREQSFFLKNTTVLEPIFDCPVAIINTTSESGLANSLASMLEKSSFSIIKKDSSTVNLTQSKVFYVPHAPGCGKLLDHLAKIFPQHFMMVDEIETLKHRASLVIYIGQDLANLYSFFIQKSTLNEFSN